MIVLSPATSSQSICCIARGIVRPQGLPIHTSSDGISPLTIASIRTSISISAVDVHRKFPNHNDKDHNHTHHTLHAARHASRHRNFHPIRNHQSRIQRPAQVSQTPLTNYIALKHLQFSKHQARCSVDFQHFTPVTTIGTTSIIYISSIFI
jgi:hypothetical protein